MEITVTNNEHGEGVVVSGLGAGSAAEEGILVGDIILSVDGAVTESSRETMKYIARAPDPLTFVVAGRDLGMTMMAANPMLT